MKYYDDEEKGLIESIDRGEWKSIGNLEEEKKRYNRVFNQNSRVQQENCGENLRIS